MPDESKGIDSRSPAIEAHSASLTLPNALMGGTPAMVAAGETYLPKGEVEDKLDYEARLKATVLLNAYKRTLGYLSGQVFGRDVALPDAVDETYRVLAENIDQRGNNLSAFSRKVFSHGIHAGASFVLVDFSQVETRTNESGALEYLGADGVWRLKTQAADAENGWRPYWTHIKPEDVIDGWCEMVNGRPRLVHFRFFERVPEDAPNSPWSRKMVRQIRVLTPGKWEIYREVKGDKGESQWVKSGEGITKPLAEIPLVVFMPGERTGDLTATPCLQDLAYLNLSHWQATSGHKRLMDWMRRPAFLGKLLTVDPNETVPFGPDRMIQSTSADADLVSVAVNPASVEASREDLRDIETSMALYGLSLLMPQTGSATATEKALNAAESDSTLKSWAKLFKDALEQCFVYTAMWWGKTDAPDVDVNTEFRAFTGTEAQDIQVLDAMCAGGRLSRETLWAEMVRRGMLDESVTPDVERDRLITQNRDGTFQDAGSRFLTTGGPAPAAGQGA